MGGDESERDGIDAEFAGGLRHQWHTYLDRVESLRPHLHALCLRLTGNVWDAEDLAQDTLLRGFGRLAHLDPERAVRDPRAFLLRIATHLWIDQVRHRQMAHRHTDAFTDDAATPDLTERAQELRAAIRTLISDLAPRERAVLALREGFDLTPTEIAPILGTSVGAVKAALHRGRGRLAEISAGSPQSAAMANAAPTQALIDRFIELFEQGDAAALAALLQTNASIELVGSSYNDQDGDHDWFDGLVHGHPDWPPIWQFEAQRLGSALVHGAVVLLVFRTRRGREKLEQVVRIDEEEGRIARLRDYGFCPDMTATVAKLLDCPYRRGPYRYPTNGR